MRIVIDHNQCKHGGAFADRCLGATILDPLGHERYCMVEMEDDSRPELTVTLRFNHQECTRTFLDEAEREVAASDGWVAFAPFANRIGKSECGWGSQQSHLSCY